MTNTIKETKKNTKEAESPGIQRVKVIDFDMKFSSMVLFIMKWALASIPAFIILFILWALLVSIFGVSMVSLFTI